MNNKELKTLSSKIAYITINPRGHFLKSAQLGFQQVNLFPEHLIYIQPTNRLKKELKKYRLSFFSKFVIPQFKRFARNKKSFNQQEVNMSILHTHIGNHLNGHQTCELIKNLDINYLINCGAGIFGKKIIDIENLIVLNAHAGKLPEYKNMNVVEWAIYNGDSVIGTIHRIDTGIDTGPVWLEEVIDISKARSLLQAREIAFDQVAKMLGKAVIMNEKGLIKPYKHPPWKGKKWYRMHSYFQNQVTKQLIQNRKI